MFRANIGLEDFMGRKLFNQLPPNKVDRVVP